MFGDPRGAMLVSRLPHRAWDDQVGVYCGSHIGIAKYIDFVHTLKRKDGTPVALIERSAL